MFKCEKCGKVFEKAAKSYYTEFMGECHGRDSFMDFEVWHCPNCGSEDIAEAFKCEICQEWNIEEKLHGGVCDACIDKERANVELVMKIGEHNTEEVEINGFLAEMFTADQINEILTKELKRAGKYFGIDCSSYIDDDKDCFAEWLKEVKK